MDTCSSTEATIVFLERKKNERVGELKNGRRLFWNLLYQYIKIIEPGLQ